MRCRPPGGVPDILVPDRCATATDRRRKSEPVKVDDAHLEMAEHYGCAAVPARVRRPRGKASAGKAVDLRETWVLAPLADERFTSLEELNAEAGRLVDALNARPFSRREGCRDDAFSGEERAALNPLPDTPFEWCGRRRCKVSPDHRVQCGDTVNLLFTICANESAPIALTYFHRFRQRFSTVFGYSASLLSRGRSFSR